MSFLDPDTLQEVADRTTVEVKNSMIEAFRALLGPDGEAFGAIPTTGGEFIAMYLDLQSRPFPLPDGRVFELRILDQLRLISPKYAASLDRQFAQEQQKLRDRAS